MTNQPPSATELERELEKVRAAQPRAMPEPSVGSLLARRLTRALVLWAALIVFFLLLWRFLNPS